MTQEMTRQGGQQLSPSSRMNRILNSKGMQELLKNVLQDKAELFTASILEVWGADSYLQQCDPAAVAKECMKAATLNLPLSKALGFAWVVPFNRSIKDGDKWIKVTEPQFQIGWKGYVQLAQRTGQYRFINAGPVYDGELRKISKLTGELDIEGDAVSDKIIGFFAHITLTNGYSKSLYWSVEKMQTHAIRYNQQCKKAGKLAGVWHSDFEAMGTKTVLATLIRRYGIMSTEMLAAEHDDQDEEDRAKVEIQMNAGAQEIGFEEQARPENVDIQTGEVLDGKPSADPGF